ALAEIKARFVDHVVRERGGQAGHQRRVAQRLNAGARKIVLPERLILRFDLNAGKLTRVVAKAHTKLVVFGDQVIQANRVVSGAVGNGKYALEIIQRPEGDI